MIWVISVWDNENQLYVKILKTGFDLTCQTAPHRPILYSSFRIWLKGIRAFFLLAASRKKMHLTSWPFFLWAASSEKGTRYYLGLCRIPRKPYLGGWQKLVLIAEWSYFRFTKTRLFKYIEIFTSKIRTFLDQKSVNFSYFYSKHRLWVLVRTASPRRF